MPEFLDLYIRELSSKTDFIKKIYNSTFDLNVSSMFREVFKRFWIPYTPPNIDPNEFNVLAVDSSSKYIDTGNGGVFYVVRSLGLSISGDVYRKLHCNFDFSFSGDFSNISSRFMEWLEHLTIIDAIESGFRGFVLFDGSLYGRFSHIPMELDLAYGRDFMIKYFLDLLKMMELAKKFKVPIIGISKGSITSFFRNFLIGVLAIEIASKLGLDDLWIKNLMYQILDRKKSALTILDKLPVDLKIVVKELLNRRPDFQLIIDYAESIGYSVPLILNPPPRTIRAFNRIKRNPLDFLKSAFPYSSISNEFIDRYIGDIVKLLDLPAVISFYLLPSKSDIPLKVDLPAWFFGFEDKFSNYDWPEIVNVDLNDILKLIVSGYCGLDNYNIWLVNVDNMVKLSRRVFEGVYLPKFEEIIGGFITSRRYRRVRYP